MTTTRLRTWTREEITEALTAPEPAWPPTVYGFGEPTVLHHRLGDEVPLVDLDLGRACQYGYRTARAETRGTR